MRELVSLPVLGVSLLLTGSGLVSLMAVFMGAKTPGLERLLAVQNLAILPALVCAISVLLWVIRSGPAPARLSAWWAAIPQWLRFAFLIINSLVAMGELSFWMIQWAAQRTTPWREHIPLMITLSGSLAFCAVYGAWQLADTRT